MRHIYKSEEGERAVRERYLTFLKYWPVANEHLRVPTREGETFVIACGDENAPPLLLLHGAVGNSAMWMGDVAAWSRHFRVYAIDMIGEAGLSAPSRPPLASEAYALWLDDVMQALSLARASLVGISLGGWLALDYATRRPDRVEKLVVLCPGGVGRQKVGFALKAILLRMCGALGKRKTREMVLGRAPAEAPPAIRKFTEFMLLIHQNFRPRLVKMPIFSDALLKLLTMPVLAIVGGRDVLLDSAGTKRRLEQNLSQVEVRYLSETGHMITRKTTPILEFLRGPVMIGGSRSHERYHATQEADGPREGRGLSV
jgi:pimeloyl-ACP methyl ester carboxylesterase